MTYREYLRSPVWKSLRLQALKKANFRCQVCNSPDELNTHHRKYPEVYGQEPVTDLVVLCRGCHRTFHTKRSLAQEVRAVTGKIRETKKRYHYWVKGMETGTRRALCNPGLVRAESTLVDAVPSDELCKVCLVHAHQVAGR